MPSPPDRLWAEPRGPNDHVLGTFLTVATGDSHAMVDENTKTVCAQLALSTGMVDARYQYEHQVPRSPCAR